MNPTSEKDTNNDINAVLQQAEILNTQIAMNTLFKKNMVFFKAASSKIYSMFENYSPSLQKLYYDPRGFINLINIQTQNPVFNEDPVSFAEKQVDEFCKMPKRLSVHYKDMVEITDKQVYPKIFNETYHTYEKITKDQKLASSYPVGLLTIVGVGMGYHLEKLIKNINFKHLFIYENNKDSFFASLFTTDWSKIGETTISKNISLNLCVGETSNYALHRMQILASDIGAHNMVHNYLYCHTTSKENTEFYSEYARTYPLIISSLGYFDDELVSFSHTIHNMNNNLPVFTPTENIKGEKFELPPVFLIGNGPSLDGELVEFIRSQQDRAIIISCGSSLSAMYKLGLTPDMHVDIERNLATAEVHALATDIEYTKNIPLLVLNSTVPNVKTLFDRVYIGIKPNDLGTVILHSAIPKNQFFQLDLCTPTATNGGLAYAIHMGFKSIYLFGYDFGMASEEEHHSKHSFYTQIEDDFNSKKSDKKVKGDFSYQTNKFFTKGNLTDIVQTNSILDLSRKNIEAKLHKHPDVQCVNPNNGAFIRGAEAKPIHEINLDSYMTIDNKEKLTNKLLDSQFTQFNFKKIGEKEIEDKYLKDTNIIIKSLAIPETITDINHFHDITDKVFLFLKTLRLQNPINCSIFSGSVMSQFCLMHSYLYKAKDKNELRELYQKGREIYQRMLEEFINRIKTDRLAIDDAGLFD